MERVGYQSVLEKGEVLVRRFEVVGCSEEDFVTPQRLLVQVWTSVLVGHLVLRWLPRFDST